MATRHRDAEPRGGEGAEHMSVEDAQELAEARAELDRAQAALREAQERATKGVAIHDYVVLRLKHKYRVGPADVLHYDGTIARESPPSRGD